MEKGDGDNYAAATPQYGQREPASPNYTPSADELRVLSECRNESFYYRCIPLGFLTVTCMKAMEIRGMMRPGLLKYMGGSLVAYLTGKWSYQKQCQVKLMGLQNSELGEALRNGKTVTQFLYEKKAQIPVRQVPAVQGEASQIGQYMSPDIDAASNVQHKGLDDNFRASIDDTSKAKKRDSAEGGSQRNTTYEELRSQNRSQFQRRPAQPVAPAAPPTPEAGPRQSDSAPTRPLADDFSPTVPDERPPKPAFLYSNEDQPQKTTGRRKNKYGDLVEE